MQLVMRLIESIKTMSKIMRMLNIPDTILTVASDLQSGTMYTCIVLRSIFTYWYSLGLANILGSIPGDFPVDILTTRRFAY